MVFGEGCCFRDEVKETRDEFYSARSLDLDHTTISESEAVNSVLGNSRRKQARVLDIYGSEADGLRSRK